MCAYRIQIRRDTLQNWSINNPIIGSGEIVWITGTQIFKIGNGIDHFNDLPELKGETPNNGKLTIQKNGTTIAEFTANQSGDTVANILADTPTFANLQGSPSDNQALSTALAGKQPTISDLSDIRSGAELGATSLQLSDIIDNTTSTATNKSLSANMGKELSDRITNLESLGRYLSEWNCVTGLAMTNPTYSPYPYRTGDYFLVLNVASVGGTNYRPSGNEYVIDEPSTTVETGTVTVGSRYIYDGTQWILQSNAQQTVSFTNIAGDPYDNSNLAGALNEKQDEIDDLDTIRSNATSGKSASDTIATYGNIVTHNTSEFATSSQGSKADSALQSGDDVSELNNDVGYLTGITSQQVTNALGYTPYNNSNPAGYQNNVLEGVQINGTDLTIDVNKKVNIPVATATVFGATKILGNGGIKASSGSAIYVEKCTDAEITAKANQYKPIVPSNLDKAVMEGLGNTTLTWSDTYKSQARATIGAGQTTVEVIDWE